MSDLVLHTIRLYPRTLTAIGAAAVLEIVVCVIKVVS